MSMCVYMSVCLSTRISLKLRARSLPNFLLLMFGSVLLWRVDDRPQRLSTGRG